MIWELRTDAIMKEMRRRGYKFKRGARERIINFMEGRSPSIGFKRQVRSFTEIIEMNLSSDVRKKHARG